ncbi:MAG TPA: hypothetical protein DDY49_13405 [Paenibacillaceae bacterium]|nr:hypothetical protein [Paenibacillaceae bacterium]
MPNKEEKLIVSVESEGRRTTAEYPVPEKLRIVIIINNQITNVPNTTQIASGAGYNSAAGNNAALDSSNTLQQQSVGGAGVAKNFGLGGPQIEPHVSQEKKKDGEEIVIVINNQINQSQPPEETVSPEPPEPQVTASATQVASGAGHDSAGGTNAAIGSSNTKQQFSVAGGDNSEAKNFTKKAPQEET